MQMHTFTFPPEPLEVRDKVSYQIQLCYNPTDPKYLCGSADDTPPLLYYLSAEPI